MRAFYIPAAILATILGFALWTGQYTQNRTDHWAAQLEAVEVVADREEWSTAERQLRSAYGDWYNSQTFFRIIMEHDQLDEAEAYFAGAMAACAQQDNEDFHIMLAQLNGKLQQLAETQSASIRNIL